MAKREFTLPYQRNERSLGFVGVHRRFSEAGRLLGALLVLLFLAVPGVGAQEGRQEALLRVEKGPQEHLLAPKPLEAPPEQVPESEEPSRPAVSAASVPQLKKKGPAAPTLDVPRTRLAIAWGYYNQGRYEKAAQSFEALVRDGEASGAAEEARLGLSYCLIRLNRLSEAAEILEDLVNRRIRLQESAPALVETLLVLKRYEDAEKYLSLLP
ncbi:MAG: Outer rane lipoprotein [Desulfacinum sp.]|jgi:tetratricopeptide (TPR) repeat protein|nr:Outer rane lipoprotein [Desulfacinum sp.]